MIKSAIFDMDGTIIDSMDAWRTVGERYLKTFGVTADDEFKDYIRTLSIYETGPYIYKRYGIKVDAKELCVAINKLMEDFYFGNPQLKNGALEFLEKLKSRGVKICLATATDRYLVEGALSRCGIDTFFSRIFTITEVGAGKENPAIYRMACDFFGEDKSQTYVFEDAFYAGNTAKNDGFKLVSVYDKYERNFEKLKDISDYCIYDFTKTDEFFEFAFK